MSGLDARKLGAILARHPSAANLRVAVETGTFKGDRADLFAAVFPTVHTIELSRPLYESALVRLGPLGVTCHYGDSRDVLPGLAHSIQEPALWYLDAHWFSLNPGPSKAGASRGAVAHIAGRAEGLPLWDELACLARRDFDDVIVVDDVRDFGTEKPTPEWREV